MFTKTIIKAFAVAVVLFSASYANSHAVYQYSVLNSLMSGVYDGNKTISELIKHGNFGVGTVNGLNGELVIADGMAYQVRSDGKVIKLAGSSKVPFAQVCFFSSQEIIAASNLGSLDDVKSFVDSKLMSKNLLYAIKIKGLFSYVKTRSVPKQSKPYIPLSEVIKKQSVFEFSTIEGVVIGFRQPDYIKEINTPGYHFHFLSKDKNAGGHVLDLRVIRADVTIDSIKDYKIEFPKDTEFLQKNLSGGLQYKP